MSGILARLGAHFLSAVPVKSALNTATPCSAMLLQRREKGTTPKRRKVHPFHWWVRKNRQNTSEDNLTVSNREFLLQQAKEMFLAPGESPLHDEPWEPGKWEPFSRRTAIVAKKMGTYPIWLTNGKKVYTALLQICDQNVLNYVPPEQWKMTRFGHRDRGKGALLIGADPRDPNKYTDAYLDMFKKAGVAPTKRVTRFIVSPNAALQPGTPLTSRHLRAGDHCSVFGKSIDRGWLGAVKRFNMKGGKATHGCTKSHNRSGSHVGPRGRILKGKKMPGHHGAERNLASGLRILRIDHVNGVVFVHGAVPGAIGDYVYIHDTKLSHKRHTDANPPPFPTYLPKEGEELVDEEFAPDVAKFDAPSIIYKEEVQVKRKLKVKAKVKAAGKR